MSRSAVLIVSLVVAGLTAADPAIAGAFMLPDGQGQFIAGVGYSAGSRRFDQSGTAMPAPRYAKADASGYLEYGLTPWLSLIVAPTLSHQNGTFAANAVTGSDSSAVGARLELFGTGDEVVALQALVQPPLGDQSAAHLLATGGDGAFATDLRLQFGTSFSVFGFPAFVDLEPGFRLHVDPLPTEARLDLAFGVRPIEQLQLLVQTFSAFLPSSGPSLPWAAYTKLQGSLVYDLSLRWSVQAGGFRTVAGRNAVRETGPFCAVWYRF